MDTSSPVAAHTQTIDHRYLLHFPEHPPRSGDPNYVDFEAYRKAHIGTAQCYVGQRIGFDECAGGLELHHSIIEFSLQNGVDLKALEVDYPGVSDPSQVGAWVESGTNLMFLCEAHHRSVEKGVHALAASDWEASKYIKGLTDVPGTPVSPGIDPGASE